MGGLNHRTGNCPAVTRRGVAVAPGGLPHDVTIFMEPWGFAMNGRRAGGGPTTERLPDIFILPVIAPRNTDKETERLPRMFHLRQKIFFPNIPG